MADALPPDCIRLIFHILVDPWQIMPFARTCKTIWAIWAKYQPKIDILSNYHSIVVINNWTGERFIVGFSYSRNSGLLKRRTFNHMRELYMNTPIGKTFNIIYAKGDNVENLLEFYITRENKIKHHATLAPYKRLAVIIPHINNTIISGSVMEDLIGRIMARLCEIFKEISKPKTSGEEAKE